MRLIDIEDIVIGGWYMEDDDGEVYIRLSDVEKCIDRTPTAFDVDAVVSKLEMFKQRHIEKAKQQGWIRWQETCNAACYAMAIKIIKAYAKRGDLNEID